MRSSHHRNHRARRLLCLTALACFVAGGTAYAYTRKAAVPQLPELPAESLAQPAENGAQQSLLTAAQAQALLEDFRTRHGHAPALHMESGRYITGPHGVLVTRAINRKDSYRTYIGVDACMSALMRPGMYGAYHHIDVVGKTASEANPHDALVDVVGSLCENNDKFAVQRPLPPVADGDLLVIHDTGAHGHAMGFNYNGKLRSAELLLNADGSVTQIRRAETLDDLFATIDFSKL